MTHDDTPPDERLIDPDPFTLVATVLAAVGTATGIYSVVQNRQSQAEGNRQRSACRRAEVLRWEAELVDLKDTLEELGQFMRPFMHDVDSGADRLSPFSTSLELSRSQLSAYRRLTSRLLRQSRKTNEAVFRLLPLIDDPATMSYLSDSIHQIRDALSNLREMLSVHSSMEIAGGILSMLLQTAAYLREEVI